MTVGVALSSALRCSSTLQSSGEEGGVGIESLFDCVEIYKTTHCTYPPALCSASFVGGYYMYDEDPATLVTVGRSSCTLLAGYFGYAAISSTDIVKIYTKYGIVAPAASCFGTVSAAFPTRMAAVHRRIYSTAAQHTRCWNILAMLLVRRKTTRPRDMACPRLWQDGYPAPHEHVNTGRAEPRAG